MAEINMTPFIDVMLVLLIVFMITAPLLTTGVDVDLPDTKAKAITSEDNKPIEITLTKDGKLHIGDTEFKEKRLIGQLRAMTEGNSDERRIYLRGDTSLTYGRVMRVIGALNAADFNNVSLISEQKTR